MLQHSVFNNIHAIFFDLDNTLINRDDAFKHTISNWLRNEITGLTEIQYTSEIEYITNADKSGFTDRDDFLMCIQSRYNLTDVDKFANYLSDRIITYIGLNNQLNEVLTCLKQRYSIGIITNGSMHNQRAKLMRAGLDHIFDNSAVYIEGERGFAKPDRRIFEQVIKDHKLRPEHFLFIGDHPINDIAGAASVGMRTAWVKNGQVLADYAISPCLVVEDTPELISVLKAQSV